MSDERRKVLEMLEEGKITQEDATRLLKALGEEEPRQEPESGEDETTIVINGEDGEKACAGEDNGNVPRLTLYPEGDDALADEISRTVEDTIEQAQKELGNDWNAIGEKINEAVTNQMNAVFSGTPPTPPAPDTENPAELTEPGTPYRWNIGKEELNSLAIDWTAGQVEIKQGSADQVVVTEYSKRPLEEDERMYITFEDGEMHIRFTEKKKSWAFRRNLITDRSKKLVVELPQGQNDLEEIRVNTTSADVSMDQLVAGLNKLEVTTASGAVSVKETHGDDLRLHTASGGVKVISAQFSDMSLQSASGSIWAASVTADDFNAHSASGSIHAAGVTAGDFQATTASGSVTIAGVTTDDLIASTASGSLSAQGFTTDDATLKTVSGSLHALGKVDSLHAETVSGGLELHLAGEADEVNLHTVSGKIQLFLPETAGGFTANYSTTTGRFDSEFPFTGTMGGKNGCVSYGQGEMEITLSTMSGSMQISRE